VPAEGNAWIKDHFSHAAWQAAQRSIGAWREAGLACLIDFGTDWLAMVTDAKAASTIACITPSSRLAQNLKLRRLYASGSASFQSTA
jgi:hypothetical protein